MAPHSPGEHRAAHGSHSEYHACHPGTLRAGAPYAESSNFDPVTGQPTDAQKNLRYNTIAFFAQDSWKLKPNLTLTLGLRWEDFIP